MNRMNRILRGASLRGSPANGGGAVRSYAHLGIIGFKAGMSMGKKWINANG
jgi:hypothetical protein